VPSSSEEKIAALNSPIAPNAAPPKRARRAFIDLARGFAVVCMVEHHSFDAWMPDAFHGTKLDHFFRFMGGVAAPAFLFLAGVAMVLMMEGGLSRGLTARASAWAAAKRGGWIFVGAYLFRFQEWVLGFGVGVYRYHSQGWAAALGNSQPGTMLRIDILNCIGLALVLTALIWFLGRSIRARAILFFLSCAAIVLAAPIVWDTNFSSLPQILFDYLRGSSPRALFPIFPWLAYAFAGALLGLQFAATRSAKDPARAERNALALWLVLGTAAWFAIGYLDALPFHLYSHLEWWRTSPAYFLLRCISMIWLLAAAWLLEQLWQPVRARFHWTRPGPLVAMGQHSLIIYWVHIELVYGSLCWPYRGKLSLAQACTWLALLFAAMTLLAYLIDPVLDGIKALAKKACALRDRPVKSLA